MRARRRPTGPDRWTRQPGKPGRRWVRVSGRAVSKPSVQASGPIPRTARWAGRRIARPDLMSRPATRPDRRIRCGKPGQGWRRSTERVVSGPSPLALLSRAAESGRPDGTAGHGLNRRTSEVASNPSRLGRPIPRKGRLIAVPCPGIRICRRPGKARRSREAGRIPSRPVRNGRWGSVAPSIGKADRRVDFQPSRLSVWESAEPSLRARSRRRRGGVGRSRNPGPGLLSRAKRRSGEPGRSRCGGQRSRVVRRSPPARRVRKPSQPRRPAESTCHG
jgi:hypothetical protein